MMNAQTGQWMSLSDHVKQSVHKILWTLQGTRLMRRTFGSLAPELIDDATSHAKLAWLRAALVMSLIKEEKRLVIKRVTFEVSEAAPIMSITSLINGQEHLFKYDLSQRAAQ